MPVMATASAMTPDGGKLSFAKVAASATKKETPASLTARKLDTKATPPTGRDGKRPPASTTAVASPCDNNAYKEAPEEMAGRPDSKAADASVAGEGADGAPTLASTDRPSKLSSSASDKAFDKASDEASQKADSSSDLGTKPPSLDGKSITSGTTFNAFDEKESLRPDDSASVKAAADEDDAFSMRGSHLVSSRLGSEMAARAGGGGGGVGGGGIGSGIGGSGGGVHHRIPLDIQLGDMPSRVALPHPSIDPAVSGAATPRSGSSDPPSGPEARAHAQVHRAANAAPPDALTSLPVQSPDEKLLDAMQTPKDRLFLLRLEGEVVNFVQNSKEPFMDLPPSNSFCRMLTHKLADYYHMTHSYEVDAGSVRIFRTPFCRVPPALASLVAATTPKTSTPPPLLQPKKIMRRGEDIELPLSSGPSKPTSEAGSDSKDKAAPAKEKMTREAREEAYNRARERIFGSSVPTEASTPENEDGNGISRASSVSAKDKANMGKKNKANKQRRDDSESFDSRSQYTPFYNRPQQPTWMPPQYMPMGANNNPHAAVPAQMPLLPSLLQPQGQLPPLPQQHQPHPHPQHQQRQHPPHPPHPQHPQHPQHLQQQQGLQQQVQQAAAIPQVPPQPISTYTNTAQSQAIYGPSGVGYPGGPTGAQTGSIPQYPRYPAQNAPSAAPYPPVAAPGVASMPPWQQAPPYPTSQMQPGQPGQSGLSPSGIPYAFGQLPVHVHPNDPKSQHPIPGSYAGSHNNRHSFNPQTQSFIPGAGAPPLPVPMPVPVSAPAPGSAPQVAYPGPAAGHGNHSHPGPVQHQHHGTRPFSHPVPGYQHAPQAALPAAPYSMPPVYGPGQPQQHSQQHPQQHPQHHPPLAKPHVGYQAPPLHSNGMHYGARHGAGPSIPHGPLPAAAVNGPHGLQMGPPRGPLHHKNVPPPLPHSGGGGGPSAHAHKQPYGPKKPAGSQVPTGPGPVYSHLPTYGNPASLPQKPTAT